MLGKINSGYETLVELRVIPRQHKISKARNAILNCVGCKLADPSSENEGVYGSGIAKCQGVDQRTVSEALMRFERAGVLASDGHHIQLRDTLYYTIAHTVVGETLRETITPPPYCPLAQA